MLIKILRLISRIRFYKYFKDDVLISNPFSYVGEATTIGEGTNINGYCYLDSRLHAPIIIGKYCAIAHNLRVRTVNHKVNYPNIQFKLQNRVKGNDLTEFKGKVEIGNNVWIGDNCIILPGVKIGNGAVIGAGSVVTRDIPSYSVSAGVPARHLKFRFSKNSIDLLENIAFWNAPDDIMSKDEGFFSRSLK